MRWVLLALALVLGIGAAHAQAPQVVAPPDVVSVPGTTTARTLAARFADVVNAKDFGVKCDGVSDDTAALQAFLTAVSTTTPSQSKIGILPAGACLFNTTLTLVASNTGWFTIQGAGMYATTLTYTGSSTTNDLLMVGGAT